MHHAVAPHSASCTQGWHWMPVCVVPPVEEEDDEEDALPTDADPTDAAADDDTDATLLHWAGVGGATQRLRDVSHHQPL